MAVQPGLEPGKQDPESCVLPITPPGNTLKPEDREQNTENRKI